MKKMCSFQKLAVLGGLSFATCALPVIAESGDKAGDIGVKEKLDADQAADAKVAQAIFDDAMKEYNREGKDTLVTMKLYEKASALGHTEATMYLADIYRDGEIVPQDVKKAIGLYKKAAKGGEAYAQNELGDAYMNGIGVLMDEKAAYKWYKKAAEGGDEFAQESLASMYEEGRAVQQDFKKAFKWNQRSAMTGWVYAQHALARMYMLGKGVEKDLVNAYAWFKLTSQDAQDLIGDDVEGLDDVEIVLKTLQEAMNEQQFK